MRSQTLREHFGFPKEASLFSADCFGTKKEEEKNNSQLSCLHWCISTTVFKGVTMICKSPRFTFIHFFQKLISRTDIQSSWVLYKQFQMSQKRANCETERT